MQQLNLRITNGNFQLHTAPANMTVERTPASLSLISKPADLEIDLQPSFNTMGLQDITSFTDSWVNDVKQAALSGIERRVAEGKQMAKPKGPSVTKIIAADAHPPVKEVGLATMPSVPPQISVQVNNVQGIYTPGKVAVQVDEGKVTSDFTWGQVQGYLVDAKA